MSPSTSVNKGACATTLLGFDVMSSRRLLALFLSQGYGVGALPLSLALSLSLSPLSLLPSWAMHRCRYACIMYAYTSLSSFCIPEGKSLGDQDQEPQVVVQSTSRATQSVLQGLRLRDIDVYNTLTGCRVWGREGRRIRGHLGTQSFIEIDSTHNPRCAEQETRENPLCTQQVGTKESKK